MQNIPVLHVTENCLAAGYEKALDEAEAAIRAKIDEYDRCPLER